MKEYALFQDIWNHLENIKKNDDVIVQAFHDFQTNPDDFPDYRYGIRIFINRKIKATFFTYISRDMELRDKESTIRKNQEAQITIHLASYVVEKMKPRIVRGEWNDETQKRSVTLPKNIRIK